MIESEIPHAHLTPDIEQFSCEDGGISYRYANNTGEMVMTEYVVFPGIHLVYNDVHMNKYDINVDILPTMEHIFQIEHCHEGRIECSHENEVFYLTEGDFAVHQKTFSQHESCFPTGHYHGITLVVNTEEAPLCLSCILDEVQVCPKLLAQKFCARNNMFITRNNKRLDHIFAELYDLPEDIKRGYMKIKVLEILLFLSSFPVENAVIQKPLMLSQVQTVKEACTYLINHPDQHITIEELSARFHISPTQLKTCFRGVYGEPIFTYVRKLKMQRAALLLRQTDKTVLEIAGMFGYTNGGKFASAFHAVMGFMPGEYRNQKQ